ncbi:uroporphyrinogen-III synthase [Gramella sp. GC03-9]|uniref:Uroporphyrinogen-III synthase n=1 Tax=Christiangramia oceanisediminis TaxID=2920386 RepID=A0A9X2I9S0_9FLAO|nr:uroporphyrinogen-III synthase [Gramella oceanisediminis]MCP9199373.1 uroporphyrinogen-III synthase [Gramella oceanisediminis]
MPTVLATRKLAPNQKELLLNAGIGLVEYDSIQIEFIDFQLPEKNLKNVIFTSKNAVRAIEKKGLKIENCYCVGEKTAELLIAKGFHVAETADNGQELGKLLVEKHAEKHFHFFCGNKRRDELPAILKENQVKLTETEVYKTTLNFRQFHSEFDGILFLSPSAVKSFTKKNKLDTTAFCIGETTAAEARKHTKDIVIASRPSIENLVARLVSHFKTN